MTKTIADRLDEAFGELPNSVTVRGFNGGLRFNWSRKGCGWGQLTMRADKNGKLVIDAETMGDEFVIGVLKQAIAEASARY